MYRLYKTTIRMENNYPNCILQKSKYFSCLVANHSFFCCIQIFFSQHEIERATHDLNVRWKPQSHIFPRILTKTPTPIHSTHALILFHHPVLTLVHAFGSDWDWLGKFSLCEKILINCITHTIRPIMSPATSNVPARILPTQAAFVHQQTSISHVHTVK